MSKITELTIKDLWRWITYTDWVWEKSVWKLKGYDNEAKTALIVFKSNSNRDAKHRTEYTAECCDYSDLSF
jgi:hypothetical protein